MSFPKPPKIDPEKLNFSQFHPLDHRVGSRRCREHYGSWRNHLTLVWDFKWEMPHKIKRVTHCTFGRHKPMPWFRGDGIPRSEGGKLVYAGHQCVWCRKTMTPASPEE